MAASVELNGRRQTRDEVLHDRPVGEQAVAEIAAKHAQVIVEQLPGERLVEAKLSAQRLDLLLRGTLASDQSRGIGRDDV